MKIVFLVILFSHVVTSIENFATKTNYKLSLKIDEIDGFFKKYPFDKVCKPVKHISSIYRHGSRYPSTKDVKNAKDILNALIPIGNDDTITKKLRAVLDTFSKKKEKALSQTGFEELEELGKELKKDNPELFKEFKKGNFLFYVTEKTRTVDSFKGFLKGIRPNEDYKPTPKVDNALLRFFDLCKKYIDEVETNNSSLVEMNSFMDKKHRDIYDEMLLSYEENYNPYNFSNKEMKSVYTIVGTEYAVNGVSEWSMFLSQKAANLLEYAADLKNFWVQGGGHPINSLQSCVILKHLFNHFDLILSNTSKSKGNFYFSHAETLIPLYTLMGLFVDKKPLTHNNYLTQRVRLFKTTRVIPFAGNIRFDLSECGGEMYIALYVKNHQMKWPCCDSFKCPYAVVKKHYQGIIKKCDFDLICLNHIGGLKTSMFSVVSLISVVLMMIF